MFGISIHKNDANVTFENFQFFFLFHYHNWTAVKNIHSFS